MKLARKGKRAERSALPRGVEDRVLRVTEQRNALKLEVVEKDEQLKVAKVRLRKLMRVLQEQERQMKKLENASFKRPSGLPGNPRNRELESAYVAAESSQTRLSHKVKELQRAKELLELRLNVVESKRALSSRGKKHSLKAWQQQQQKKQKQDQDLRQHRHQEVDGDIAHEQALVLVSTLQQRLLEALREKRSIQMRALQAFDDLDIKAEDEEDGGRSSSSHDFARIEMQRLHKDLERVHADLRSSESARLHLLGKMKAPASPTRLPKTSVSKGNRSLEEKTILYRVS